MSRFLVCLLFLCLCCGIQAQEPQPESAALAKPLATISFDLMFPGANPSHYSMELGSSGHVSYRSEYTSPQNNRELSPADPYRREFTISKAICDRVFQLAGAANYFNGNFNYSKGRIANLGTKTLTYTEVPDEAAGKTTAIRHQTVYNYSENRAIQQLTTIFQSLANTIELGRRLRFDHRFAKLGLDADLKNAEEMARSGQLSELQVITPELHEIVDDTSVLHIARESAQRLLDQAASGK